MEHNEIKKQLEEGKKLTIKINNLMHEELQREDIPFKVILTNISFALTNSLSGLLLSIQGSHDREKFIVAVNDYTKILRQQAIEMYDTLLRKP